MAILQDHRVVTTVGKWSAPPIELRFRGLPPDCAALEPHPGGFPLKCTSVEHVVNVTSERVAARHGAPHAPDQVGAIVACLVALQVREDLPSLP